MVHILSIDCANKSMGVTIGQLIDLDEVKKTLISHLKELKSPTAKFTPKKIMKMMKYLNYSVIPVKMLYCDVIDLLPGKKLKESGVEERTSRLNGALTFICDLNKKNGFPPFDVILLENQMGANDKSKEVCMKCVQYFSKPDYGFESKTKIGQTFKTSQKYVSQPAHPRIFVVNPTYKNNVYFSETGRYEVFLEKYMNLYTANKNHCKYNFLDWIKNTHNEHLIDGIPKKNLDDVADSAMQMYAWVIRTY